MRQHRHLQIIAAIIIALSATVAGQAAVERSANADNIAQIQEQLERNHEQPVTDAMVAEIQRALEGDPQNMVAHMTLAQCYDRLAMPDMANDEYALAVKFSPDDPHALVEFVKAQIKTGHPQVAMKLLEAASKRFPQDPEVMFWYANYLATTNRTSEASALYNIALKHNAKILGLASALGQLRLDEGRYGDANQLANQDLALDKNFILAYRVKGFALANLSRWSEAQAPLHLAYEQQPFKGGVAKMYAKACSWGGDYHSALEPALVDLAITASLDANNLEQKAAVLDIIRKLPRDFSTAKIGIVSVNLDKTLHNPAFHFALGDVLDHAGMHDAAIEQYDKGLQIAPDYSRAIFRLGKDMELYKQQYKEALFCYSKAHQLSPGDPEITAYYARLNQRLQTRQEDIAWRLKDWISRMHQ